MVLRIFYCDLCMNEDLGRIWVKAIATCRDIAEALCTKIKETTRFASIAGVPASIRTGHFQN